MKARGKQRSKTFAGNGASLDERADVIGSTLRTTVAEIAKSQAIANEHSASMMLYG